MPGSYLATHWNVFTSRFMCAASTCALGATALPPVSSSAPPSSPTPPSPGTTPPTAAIALRTAAGAQTDRAAAGTPLILDASGSRAGSRTISGYAWDADGDGRQDGSGPTLSFTYPDPGTYVAYVVVRDGRGSEGATTRAIRVGAPGSAPRVDVAPSLRAALAGARRALLRLGLRRLRDGGALTVRLYGVAPGRLSIVLRSGSRSLASAERAVAPGRTASLRIHLLDRGLAALHRTRRARLVLSLVFVDAGGRRTVRATTLTLRR